MESQNIILYFSLQVIFTTSHHNPASSIIYAVSHLSIDIPQHELVYLLQFTAAGVIVSNPHISVVELIFI